MKSRPGRDSRDVCPVIRSTLLPVRGGWREERERERDRETILSLLPRRPWWNTSFAFQSVSRLPTDTSCENRSTPTIHGFHGNQSTKGEGENCRRALFRRHSQPRRATLLPILPPSPESTFNGIEHPVFISRRCRSFGTPYCLEYFLLILLIFLFWKKLLRFFEKN